METHWNRKARHISQCLELAILLEASADKPGNVNRTRGFQTTSYEHFLASAVALSIPFEDAAELGEAVSMKKIAVKDVGVGRTIKDCVEAVNVWQHGGNTLLGTSILFAPVAVAAGMTEDRHLAFPITQLRENLRTVAESTTAEDAVNVYQAIKIAHPGGLGTATELDVNDPNSIERIRNENIPLYEVFRMASDRDMICSEWVSNYHVTFDVAYLALVGHLREKHNLRNAVLHSFLEVLAQYPDTLIARKTSMEKAREISLSAKRILKLGETESVEGRRSLAEFDHALRNEGNLLNPGTTADIVAAALALAVLEGFRL